MVQTIVDSPQLSKINQSNQTMRPNSNSIHLYLAIFFSCIGGFMFGYENHFKLISKRLSLFTLPQPRYDTGIISGAMLLMKSEFNLTVFEQSTIVTVTILGAWLFSLVAGYSADRFGK